jgi:hypothetical protein
LFLFPLRLLFLSRTPELRRRAGTGIAICSFFLFLLYPLYTFTVYYFLPTQELRRGAGIGIHGNMSRARGNSSECVARTSWADTGRRGQAVACEKLPWWASRYLGRATEQNRELAPMVDASIT